MALEPNTTPGTKSVGPSHFHKIPIQRENWLGCIFGGVFLKVYFGEMDLACASSELCEFIQHGLPFNMYVIFILEAKVSGSYLVAKSFTNCEVTDF